MYVCSDALELNGTLITREQKEYHESLNSGFQDIVGRLSEMFGEKVCGNKPVLYSVIFTRMKSNLCTLTRLLCFIMPPA